MYKFIPNQLCSSNILEEPFFQTYTEPSPIEMKDMILYLVNHWMDNASPARFLDFCGTGRSIHSERPMTAPEI